MALQFNQLLTLMKTVAKADPSAATSYSYNNETFTYEELDTTLRNEMNELAGTFQLYRENKNTLFALIEQTLDEVLPKKVMEAYNTFAETKTYAQGDKPVFKRKLGRQRAKQFITKVGLAGIYEVFKLGSESFEVTTSAIGGAAQIGLEEYLDGRVDFAELTAIVMEGMNDIVYQEIAKALVSSINQLPPANIAAETGFAADKFDNLLSIASAYGVPTIYCTHEFATKMLPATADWYSDAMKAERWNKGYFTNYKGYNVVILPQSFTDETNSKKVIDPGYCWIIPSGVDGKPVKIAFEGNTIVDEFKNADRTREIQVYKKVGVGVMVNHGICSYVDLALTFDDDEKSDYPGDTDMVAKL